MTIYSIASCSVGITTLGILMLLFIAKRIRIRLDTYRCVRTFGAIIIVAHALVSIWRIATNVAIAGKLETSFIPELGGYLLFWILFPPMWFFLEYLGADSGVITGIADADKEANLKHMKDYQDLASKIWAAVVAVLVILISLRSR